MTTLALPAQHDLTTLPTFQRAVLGYLAQFRGTTLDAYKHDLLVFLAWLDERHLDPLLVQRDHLNLYVAWNQQHPARWAESTIARRIGTVCGLYTYLTDEDLIVKDPGRKVARPKVDHDKQRCTFLPPVDLATLIKYTFNNGTPTQKALIGILGMRGLRIAEATSLDVEHYTHQRGYRVLSYIAKGSKARTAVVPVPVARAIDECIGQRSTGPILLNKWGRRMDRKVAARHVKELAAAAGVDSDISAHSLRRSFATAAIAKGEPLYEVSLAMGHASTNTTQRYDQLAKNLDRDVSQSVAGFLSNLAG